MVEIKPDELTWIGEGPCYPDYKIYLPKVGHQHLNLTARDKVDYYIVLDPRYKDMIVIKKKTKQ